MSLLPSLIPSSPMYSPETSQYGMDLYHPALEGTTPNDQYFYQNIQYELNRLANMAGVPYEGYSCDGPESCEHTCGPCIRREDLVTRLAAVAAMPAPIDIHEGYEDEARIVALDAITNGGNYSILQIVEARLFMLWEDLRFLQYGRHWQLAALATERIKLMNLSLRHSDIGNRQRNLSRRPIRHMTREGMEEWMRRRYGADWARQADEDAHQRIVVETEIKRCYNLIYQLENEDLNKCLTIKVQNRMYRIDTILELVRHLVEALTDGDDERVQCNTVILLFGSRDAPFGGGLGWTEGMEFGVSDEETVYQIVCMAKQSGVFNDQVLAELDEGDALDNQGMLDDMLESWFDDDAGEKYVRQDLD